MGWANLQNNRLCTFKIDKTWTILAEPTFADRHTTFLWAGMGNLTKVCDFRLVFHLWWRLLVTKTSMNYY